MLSRGRRLKRKCLLERNQTLGGIASGERPHDRLRTSVATALAQARQRLRIALAGKDHEDEAQPVAPLMSAGPGGVEDLSPSSPAYA